jgi:polysaccharide biosynthesis PFTS motif protein
MARRLVVQCVPHKGIAASPDFFYDRFPLQFLIRRTKLGVSGRAVLLGMHLVAPLVFLWSIVRMPLLAVLARDFAFAFGVNALDRYRMIESVVITNSAYTAQPLWMRGPATRRFAVHMVWYSQNTRPVVYARDGFAADLPNYRHARMDETWVWTSGYKSYLEQLGLPCVIHVVGPILWYLPEPAQPRVEKDICIVVFDVTPVRDDAAERIGLIGNYYCAENMIRFIEEVLAVCREVEKKSGGRVRLMLKHKRSYNQAHDQRYIDLIERLSAPQGDMTLVPFQTNMYALLAGSDVSIVVPWSSPAYVAAHLGAQAVFFDPAMELLPTFEQTSRVKFASGRAELLTLLARTVCRKPRKQESPPSTEDAVPDDG